MSKDNPAIVLRDKIYIPVTEVSEKDVQKHYRHVMYDENGCRRCEHRPERHSYVCDSCESYKGTVRTYSEVTRGGIQYFGVPIGDRLEIERKLRFDFDDYPVVDKRVVNTFDYDVKLKGLTLYDYQNQAAREWWKVKHGMVVAPPRSGKTPTALAMIVKLGQRAIYIANQREYLTQFVEHIEEFTNLPQLEKEHGVKLYGFAKKMEDFKTLQIAVSTYQQFISTDLGRERLRAMVPNFGTMCVDEADKAAANQFASVLNSIPAKFKMGFTGTDERRDGRHVITEQIIGPVATRIEIPQLTPKLFLHETPNVKSRAKYVGKPGFVRCCQFLARHKKRTAMIVDWVEKDIANGHCIVIPCWHREHIEDLVKKINERMGEEVAMRFVGAQGKKGIAERERVVELARSRKIKVVVGVRSIVQRGINVPAWSALYYVVPANNEPNWKQESSRVLTPDSSGLKRGPIIRMFVDPEINLALGCALGTYKSSIKFKHAPSEKAKELAAKLESKRRRKYVADDDSGSSIPVDYEADDNYKSVKNKTKLKAKAPAKGLFGKLKKLR